MAKKKPLRFSVDKKMELALQLISGASLEEMSRKTGRPAYELNQWKELFLQYGRTGLMAKTTSSKDLSQAEIK